MSRKLTASDRSALIRLASTLPKGSPERKAILAGLSKTAAPITAREAREIAEEAEERASLMEGLVKDFGAKPGSDLDTLAFCLGKVSDHYRNAAVAIANSDASNAEINLVNARGYAEEGYDMTRALRKAMTRALQTDPDIRKDADPRLMKDTGDFLRGVSRRRLR